LGLCVGLTLAAASLQAGTACAQSAGPFEIGIDQSNMIWEAKPKQASIFAGVHAMGARWFRDAFAYPPSRIPDFVDVVRQAKQANLKMLVVIVQDASDYDGADPKTENAGPAFKKLCGWPGGSLKLSRINLTRFRNRLSGLLTALKAARLDVDAFEIGNEDDWVCFNGDVPFGRPATPNDISVAARGYARFLQAAADTIHDSRFFPGARIVTFGISHADAGWDENPPHHLPNPAAFVASLRNLDGRNYLDNARYRIDGYGTHIYPDPDDIKRSAIATIAKDVEALGPDIPIWITEFGLRKERFPNRNGKSRAQAITTFFDALTEVPRETFGPVFYYNYDGPSWGLVDVKGGLLPEAQALMRECSACLSGQP
jgi:hypothetical protein